MVPESSLIRSNSTQKYPKMKRIIRSGAKKNGKIHHLNHDFEHVGEIAICLKTPYTTVCT